MQACLCASCHDVTDTVGSGHIFLASRHFDSVGVHKLVQYGQVKRLNLEMFDAFFLVLDTAVATKGWTTQKAKAACECHKSHDVLEV